MDVIGAQLEPLNRYTEFHERLNVTVKLMTVAGNVLETFLGGEDKTLGDLIKAADPSWKFPPIWNLDAHRREHLRFAISDVGIVAAFSSFDDTLNCYSAEVDRWNARRDQREARALDMSGAEDDADQEVDMVVRIYNRLGWSTSRLRNTLPLLRYFRLCRNCIAHRASRASASLSKYSADEGFRKVLRKRGKPKAPAEDLPLFESEQAVYLIPRQVIFCSHILREIVFDANDHLIDFLGADGIVAMAAHHALLADTPMPTEAKTPEKVIRSLLQQRYKVQVTTHAELIRDLKRIGIWDECRSGFNALRR